MREQTKWRRVLAAALIGLGLALVGAGAVAASTNDAVWVSDAVWVNAVSAPTTPTTPEPATHPAFVPDDAVWVQ
jgi:hypothetical protein